MSMFKYYFRQNYRYPRTTQEKRANQDRAWCRPKRRPQRLASVYDDKPIHKSKSWKDRGLKTQYRIVEMRPRNSPRS